jgi:hypothetical protein
MIDFPTSPAVGALFTGPNGAIYRWDGTAWASASPPPSLVNSFNGRTGAVVMAQGDVASALGYTAYDAANPSHYIGDAPNDGVAYVRQSLAWLNGDTHFMLQSAADVRYVQLNGAAPMTGLLTLSGAPTAVNHAVTKAYADALRPTGIPFVAATAGPASVTGTTGETNLAALRIPANSMGANGVVQITSLWTYPNSSNNKTMLCRYTATAGTTGGGSTNLVGANNVVTTTVNSQITQILRNNNATNSQICYGGIPTTPFGATVGPATTQAIDTTADSYININGTLALSTETLTLVHAYAVVFPHA